MNILKILKFLIILYIRFLKKNELINKINNEKQFFIDNYLNHYVSSKKQKFKDIFEKIDTIFLKILNKEIINDINQIIKDLDCKDKDPFFNRINEKNDKLCTLVNKFEEIKKYL
jgi:hypothetical protein